MFKVNYYAPPGGHPPQTQLLTDRAMFTEAYAVLPKGVLQDIVTSFLPGWENTCLWVLASSSVRLCRDLLPIHHGSWSSGWQ